MTSQGGLLFEWSYIYDLTHNHFKLYISNLVLYKYHRCEVWHHSPDIKPFRLWFTLNPDGTIRMYLSCSVRPLLRYSFLRKIPSLRIIICRPTQSALRGLYCDLSVFAYISWLCASQLGRVNQRAYHNPNCCNWWGLKYCMIGRANGPRHIRDKIVYIRARTHWIEVSEIIVFIHSIPSSMLKLIHTILFSKKWPYHSIRIHGAESPKWWNDSG